MSYIKDAHFDAIARGMRPTTTTTPARPAPAAPATVQVPSSRGGGTTYQVAINGSACSCPGHTYHGHCKHADAQRARWEARPATFCTPGRGGAIIGDLVDRRLRRAA